MESPSHYNKSPKPLLKKLRSYSKYDLGPKIKVHINGHYYFFSRFLLTRILMLVKIS